GFPALGRQLRRHRGHPIHRAWNEASAASYTASELVGEWGERMQPDVDERPEREIDLLRREIDEHPGRAMVVRSAPASPDLYYVFMGKDVVRENLRRGDAAPELLADLKALSFYREASITSANLVMLRDYYRFFYHAGLNRDVSSIDEVIGLLASTRDAMTHVEASATLGSSAGGYAAILFGHHVAVD